MECKSGKPTLYLALLIPWLTFFLFISCDSRKNDLIYGGTWQFTEEINTDGLEFNTIRTLILTKGSYEETYLVQRKNSPSVSEIIGTRGELILARSRIYFKLEGLGSCVRDASDICTGTVQWYSEGSPYWNLNIPFFKPVVPGDFEADESTLWLTRDLNTDGDTDDAGENIVFKRI